MIKSAYARLILRADFADPVPISPRRFVARAAARIRYRFWSVLSWLYRRYGSNDKTLMRLAMLSIYWAWVSGIYGLERRSVAKGF